MIRLMIADDHAIVRRGLKKLFDANPEIVVAAEATNGDEVLKRLAEGGIDLLLLDMTMPGPCGEKLIGDIRSRYPALRILVLTMHDEPQIAQRALVAGALGYLTKDNEPEVLFAAITRVAAGRHFLDPAVAGQLALAATGITCVADHACMTTREFEVFRLLADGLTVKEIADLLGINDRTVSTHKARLMEKMDFASTADLVRYAVTHKIA
jgi:DNA-binding NarL/FixJ family response regulator